LRDNIIYGTTAFCFAQDSFLADTNTVGMSYGAFNNSKDMALIYLSKDIVGRL
jgi:hypothetical protein